MKASLLIALLLISSVTHGQVASEDIVLNTPSGDLSGTLTFPEGKQKTDLVVIVPGSGPTDRNGSNPLGVATNSYKMIAEALATQEIACLRYDKRGVGKSQSAGLSEEDLRFETYIDDLIAWADMLRSDQRFMKIILAGHSEGSLISMVAARSPSVDAFISLEGPGKPIQEVINDQLSSQPPMVQNEARRIMDELLAGNRVDSIAPFMFSLFRPSVQPYMISWMKYDPAKVLAQLEKPVLLIQGTTDLQVNVESARLLKQAQPQANLIVIEGMNHILKKAPADRIQNMATYTNPDLPLHEKLITTMVTFVHSIN